MRIMKGKSQDPTYHVIQDVKRNGKRSTEIIENLGNASTIRAKYGIVDVDAWADEYIRKLRAENSEKDHKVLIPFNTTQMIKSGEQLSFNALHTSTGIRTDYELTTPKAMAGIIRRTKGL